MERELINPQTSSFRQSHCAPPRCPRSGRGRRPGVNARQESEERSRGALFVRATRRPPIRNRRSVPSPPSRGCRIASTQAARANPARSSRRRNARPSRPGRARPWQATNPRRNVRSAKWPTGYRGRGGPQPGLRARHPTRWALR